jgi:hypothetical protein
VSRRRPVVRWWVIALSIILAWGLATCPISAQAPTRTLQILVDSSVYRATDSLAALGYREHLERGACLLGHWAPDTLWVQVVIDGVMYERTATSVHFSCPAGVTVGVWHNHLPIQPARQPPQPPLAWCALSPLDEVAAVAWMRGGVGLQVITVVPGTRCAWWVAPDGKLVPLSFADAQS